MTNTENKAPRITKKEMFGQIIALAKGEEVTVSAEEIVAFANHERELLDKKGGGTAKPTKTQTENVKYKETILAILAETGRPMMISELMADIRLDGLKNQRISALLKQLRDAEQVTRTYVKKQAYFALTA